MTTQQQTEQPVELGERVAKLEGGFYELSVRVETLQRSVDSLRQETHADSAALRAELQVADAALRAEMQAGFAELRAELNRFKSQMVFLVLGAWATTVVTVVTSIFATAGSR